MVTAAMRRSYMCVWREKILSEAFKVDAHPLVIALFPARRIFVDIASQEKALSVICKTYC